MGNPCAAQCAALLQEFTVSAVMDRWIAPLIASNPVVPVSLMTGLLAINWQLIKHLVQLHLVRPTSPPRLEVLPLPHCGAEVTPSIPAAASTGATRSLHVFNLQVRGVQLNRVLSATEFSELRTALPMPDTTIASATRAPPVVGDACGEACGGAARRACRRAISAFSACRRASCSASA